MVPLNAFVVSINSLALFSHRDEDNDDPVQAKTNEVTDALRRTVGTMKSELERSVMVTQMFGEP